MTTTTIQLKFDWRIICLVLLLVIGIMLALWRPWQKTAATTQTITVRGEAVIDRAPDSFRFQPVYQGADSQKLTATSNAVVAQLKSLGVKDADIKTDASSSSDKPVPLDASSTSSSVMPTRPLPTPSASYVITLTVNDKSLAQKVADYLATTGASGQITPQADFTKATRAKLDLEARAQASDDAKAKAKATAEGLGAKVGKVVKISEDTGYGFMSQEGVATSDIAKSSGSGPTLQPGTGQVSYAFTVIFELK